MPLVPWRCWAERGFEEASGSPRLITSDDRARAAVPHLLSRLVHRRLAGSCPPPALLVQALLPSLLSCAWIAPLLPAVMPSSAAAAPRSVDRPTAPQRVVISASGPAPWDPAALAALTADCPALRRAAGELLRQRQLQLRQLLPPQPELAQVLPLADALLACAAPLAALEVLGRVDAPEAGAERQAWLLARWRAAQAGLHHAEAAQALHLLVDGDLSRLETLALPLRLPGDGAEASSDGAKRPSRVGLDLLADHLESLELPAEAAVVLLASRQPGVLSAARWGRAARLARQLPLQQRDAIVERALEQAAAAQAWGLVAALLDQQLAAGVSDAASRQALERRLRLGARIDDAYGEWQQRRRQPGAAADARLQELERQLRSPRAAGGHADPAMAAPGSPTLAPSASPLP